MNKNTLVCTECDRLVIVECGYEGYRARCDCRKSFALTVGSGRRPRTWQKWEDVNEPANFTLYCEGHIHAGEYVDNDYIFCCRCQSKENTEVSVDEVDLPGADMKATFRCVADHYSDDRVLESVAYYNSERQRGESVVALAGDTND